MNLLRQISKKTKQALLFTEAVQKDPDKMLADWRFAPLEANLLLIAECWAWISKLEDMSCSRADLLTVLYTKHLEKSSGDSSFLGW